MTTLRPVSTHRTAQHVGAPAPAARAAGLRWSWRLTRRGSYLLWLAMATYMTVEVVSYRSAYPDAASRQKLIELSSSTAVRMLQGTPGAVDTPGGFSVWDGGWMMSLILASWAVLVTTRLTRGEEDAGRVELLLSRPIGARRLLAAHLGAVGIALAGTGVAAATPLLVFGQPVAGAVLWGAGLALFGALTAAAAALCAQLTRPRRQVSSAAFGLAALAFLVRVVANSADSRLWALRLTPFGWLDLLRPFAGEHWWWLAAPLLATSVLVAAALALVGRRDCGAALLGGRESRRSRFGLLTGSGAFGWRLTAPALVAWTVAMAVTSVVYGLMIGAIVDFIAKDDTYRRMLESMGMDMSAPVIGFVSYIATFLALPLACFLGWRLGALRQEEADGRLDNLLVRGVIRWRWLTVAAVQALVAAALLAAVSGAGLWVGAGLADAGVGAAQVAEPMLGTLPVLAFTTGLATLAFGLAPRVTVALPVTLSVLAYLVQTFGSLLHWSPAVLALSPFHHLARLPEQPMTAASIWVLTGLGLGLAGIGIVGFARRDLRGA